MRGGEVGRERGRCGEREKDGQTDTPGHREQGRSYPGETEGLKLQDNSGIALLYNCHLVEKISFFIHLGPGACP